MGFGRVGCTAIVANTEIRLQEVKERLAELLVILVVEVTDCNSE